MDKIIIIIASIFTFTSWQIQVLASCCDSVAPAVRSVLNPTTPYTERLPERLSPGDLVRIKGSTKQNADIFTINLSTGPNTRDDPIRNDTGLHISVRFKEGIIVRNWLKNSEWSKEERDAADSVPIRAGDQLEIVIECNNLEYKISINGKQFSNFPYKIPLEELTHLVIDGEIQISSITFKGEVSLNCDVQAQKIINPSLNFVKHLPLALRPSPGQKYVIEGTTKPTTDVFTINLAAGDHPAPDRDDTGLHISIRFKEGVVVRNWIKNGSWSTEQRNGGLPIKAGDSFKIVIFCDKHEYEININGASFASFPYKIPVEALSYLIIDGEAQISSIGFGHQCCTSIPPILNPSIPYAKILPVVLASGQKIRIQGNTNLNADRFTVNLATGPNTKDDPIRNDTGLHISVRFKEGVIVMNWLKGGEWSVEQLGSNGSIPIQAGRDFEILIFCDLHEYEISINGEYFSKFPYKISIRELTYLVIDGDVHISRILFEGQQSSTC